MHILSCVTTREKLPETTQKLIDLFPQYLPEGHPWQIRPDRSLLIRTNELRAVVIATPAPPTKPSSSMSPEARLVDYSERSPSAGDFSPSPAGIAPWVSVEKSKSSCPTCKREPPPLSPAPRRTQRPPQTPFPPPEFLSPENRKRLCCYQSPGGNRTVWTVESPQSLSCQKREKEASPLPIPTIAQARQKASNLPQPPNKKSLST